jgi:hypothetical protein
MWALNKNTKMNRKNKKTRATGLKFESQKLTQVKTTT